MSPCLMERLLIRFFNDDLALTTVRDVVWLTTRTVEYSSSISQGRGRFGNDCPYYTVFDRGVKIHLFQMEPPILPYGPGALFVFDILNSQWDITCWFPWYNNVDLDTWLRFGVP
jgi:hypothetical protein